MHGACSCPGQVLACLPAEKTLRPQVTWGTRGHSWVGFSWLVLKPSGFDSLPRDTPQEQPLPFNPPCTFCLSLQSSLTLAAGQRGKNPSGRCRAHLGLRLPVLPEIKGEEARAQNMDGNPPARQDGQLGLHGPHTQPKPLPALSPRVRAAQPSLVGISRAGRMELGPPSIAGVQDAGPGQRLAGGSCSIPASSARPWLGARHPGWVVAVVCSCVDLSPGASAMCRGFPSSPSNTQTTLDVPQGPGLHPEDRDAANPPSDTPLCPVLSHSLCPKAQHTCTPMLWDPPSHLHPTIPSLLSPSQSPGLGARSGEPRVPSVGAQVATETRHLLSHLRGPCRRCCIFRTCFLPPTCSPETPFGFLTSCFSCWRLSGSPGPSAGRAGLGVQRGAPYPAGGLSQAPSRPGRCWEPGWCREPDSFMHGADAAAAVQGTSSPPWLSPGKGESGLQGCRKRDEPSVLQHADCAGLHHAVPGCTTLRHGYPCVARAMLCRSRHTALRFPCCPAPCWSHHAGLHHAGCATPFFQCNAAT